MYYRNLKDLVSIEGIEVEAGSLWKHEQEDNLLVLIDEDQYASTQLDEDSFIDE